MIAFFYHIMDLETYLLNTLFLTLIKYLLCTGIKLFRNEEN